jgi:membrane protease YdiL (CAAX protease family)
MGTLIFNTQIRKQAPPPPPAQSNPAEVLPPEQGDALTLTMKLTVAFKPLLGGQAQAAINQLQASVKTEPDQVRLAIVAAELAGAKEAIARLDAVNATGELATDVEILKRAYGSTGRLTDPDDEKRMVDHHGWFGRLAGSHGLPETDPRREAVFAFVVPLMLAFLLIGVVLFVAIVGGIAAFITMLIKLSHGRLRRAFIPPAPGGSVYLEAFPFFVTGFLALSLGFEAYANFSGSKSPNLAVAQLATQWVLALFPLYPVVFRGVPFAQWRRDIGLHTGAGFWREVGAGLLGYFAGLPLLAAAMLFSFGAMAARYYIEKMLTGTEAGPPHNPIADVLAQGSPAVIIALFVLATCWAPLVEEMVLRGCLFRHLRSRFRLIGAAVISALFFGLMHGYNILLLMPVITIGFVFALMREWRGSIIPSITAHFLHNATVMTMVLLVLHALKE